MQNKRKVAYSRAKRRIFAQPTWMKQSAYAVRNLVDYIRHHKMSTLLTLLVIAISVSLPSIVYLLWKNSNEASSKWYPTPNMTVYVSTSLNEEQGLNLQHQIDAMTSVKTSSFLSREETLQEFRDWSGFGPAVDMLDDNPLPAVIIVTPSDDVLKSDEALSTLKDSLQALSGIDDIKLDNSWFTRLIALTDMVGGITLALAVMMTVAVFLVIGNSIRLNIFARCDTIKVMQLIGATEGFIFRPFLYNGAFFGFFGAVLAIILAQLFIWRIDVSIAEVSALFGTHFTIQGFTWEESLLLLILSTLIGWMSAWIATAKYLKTNYI